MKSLNKGDIVKWNGSDWKIMTKFSDDEYMIGQDNSPEEFIITANELIKNNPDLAEGCCKESKITMMVPDCSQLTQEIKDLVSASNLTNHQYDQLGTVEFTGDRTMCLNLEKQLVAAGLKTIQRDLSESCEDTVAEIDKIDAKLAELRKNGEVDSELYKHLLDKKNAFMGKAMNQCGEGCCKKESMHARDYQFGEIVWYKGEEFTIAEIDEENDEVEIENIDGDNAFWVKVSELEGNEEYNESKQVKKEDKETAKTYIGSASMLLSQLEQVLDEGKFDKAQVSQVTSLVMEFLQKVQNELPSISESKRSKKESSPVETIVNKENGNTYEIFDDGFTITFDKTGSRIGDKQYASADEAIATLKKFSAKESITSEEEIVQKVRNYVQQSSGINFNIQKDSDGSYYVKNFDESGHSNGDIERYMMELEHDYPGVFEYEGVDFDDRIFFRIHL